MSFSVDAPIPGEGVARKQFVVTFDKDGGDTQVRRFWGKLGPNTQAFDNSVKDKFDIPHHWGLKYITPSGMEADDFVDEIRNHIWGDIGAQAWFSEESMFKDDAFHFHVRAVKPSRRNNMTQSNARLCPSGKARKTNDTWQKIANKKASKYCARLKDGNFVMANKDIPDAGEDAPKSEYP